MSGKDSLKSDVLDALDDAIELAVDFHRPVTEKNLRRVKARLIASIVRPGVVCREAPKEEAA